MTDTERYVNRTCERIVDSGHVRLYRDLYQDLRERLPCGAVCRLITAGLVGTRIYGPDLTLAGAGRTRADRARAVAALTRLQRYSDARDMAAMEERNASLAWRT